MAHEVVKHVGERAYRYSVESYRDPASGKVRGRWTYLGRVDAGGIPRRRAAEASALTRERLLAALERLLEREDFARIGAASIAVEAGVAHGTFYRHFRNKRDALTALFDRAKAEIDRVRPGFDERLGSLEEERVRVRRWVETALASPFKRPGFLRAWFAAIATDPEIGAARRTRRAVTSADLAGYLRALAEAGLTRLADPEGTSVALLALFDGLLRAAVVDGTPIDAPLIAGARAVFERTIFGSEA